MKYICKLKFEYDDFYLYGRSCCFELNYKEKGFFKSYKTITLFSLSEINLALSPNNFEEQLDEKLDYILNINREDLIAMVKREILEEERINKKQVKKDSILDEKLLKVGKLLKGFKFEVEI